MTTPFKPKQALDFDGALLQELQGDISEAIAGKLIKELPPLKKSSVVHDNGCGYGAVTIALMETELPADIQVQATDINPMFLTQLQAKLKQNPTWPVKAESMDAQKLTTLKPGATGVIAVWKDMPWHAALEKAHHKTRGDDEPLPPFLSKAWHKKEKLEQVVQEAGWKNVNFLEMDAYLKLGVDLRRWATIAWTFLATPVGGWKQRDEDKWDEALDCIVEELRNSQERKVEGGHCMYKFRVTAMNEFRHAPRKPRRNVPIFTENLVAYQNIKYKGATWPVRYVSLRKKAGCRESRLLTVWFGGNDCNPIGSIPQYVPVDRFKFNLGDLISHRAVTAHEPNIILITPPPVDETLLFESGKRDAAGNFEQGREASGIKLYTEAVKEVGIITGVPVVDIWSRFMSMAGWDGEGELPGTRKLGKNEVLASLLSDGLHLTPKGYHVVWEELAKVLIEKFPDFPPYKMPYDVKVPWEVARGDQYWDVNDPMMPPVVGKHSGE
ncbi:putative GDSL esterase/lipase [Glarea lozoyensis 74030]|uniref:Putative GDSL esterase/lipase n=1 Tax=Glarea lozoyensis (strain ATCC 74030 / MF5533) TaxID=1104152 RepID=H0ERW6_GLAL7|nr:putative GDSL esterase/lipase [Glarea lozoyensis 74030]